MKTTSLRFGLLAATLLAACSTLVPVHAGMDVEFGAVVRSSDHSDLFFSISSRYFDRDRPTLEVWGHRFANPDDLAVFLFLVQRSGKSPDLIFSLRRDGNSWFDVGAKIGVPTEVWFVTTESDPGPPFGKSYEQWKKSKRRPRHERFTLSDVDSRNLIAVRMLHEYYGIPVRRAMDMRASGRDVRVLVVGEYHARHGNRMEASRPRPHPRKKPSSDAKSHREDRHHD